MYDAKVDANQKPIVDVLRACGCSVELLHRVGRGCPDILVGISGVNVLCEIKAEKGFLNQEQLEWHAAWRGEPVVILRSVEEAETLVKGIRRRVIWKKEMRGSDRKKVRI